MTMTKTITGKPHLKSLQSSSYISSIITFLLRVTGCGAISKS